MRHSCEAQFCSHGVCHRGTFFMRAHLHGCMGRKLQRERQALAMVSKQHTGTAHAEQALHSTPSTVHTHSNCCCRLPVNHMTDEDAAPPHAHDTQMCGIEQP